jgi:triacylglycerol lipase
VCEKPWLGPEWVLPYQIVNRAEGPNDGVVSVASAKWGEHTDLWDGDHLNLVNWPNRMAAGISSQVGTISPILARPALRSGQ